MNEKLINIVKKHYEPVAGKMVGNMEGAQMWQKQWWMPRWGCDTLQNMLEDINNLIKK